MTTAARPAPLTRHPAFRWGVAAWFALLLGLGLFVMPEAVHQAIGEKLGLGGVLPGAEAKRVVLSLLAALLGLGIGLVLAMRVTELSDAREPGWWKHPAGFSPRQEDVSPQFVISWPFAL